MLYMASPTFRTMIHQVGGDVAIHIEDDLGHVAYMNPADRSIHIAGIPANSPEDALTSLAFELTNVAMIPRFKEVNARALMGHITSARDFGEAVEAAEYETALNMSSYFREAQHALQENGFGMNPEKWFSAVDETGQVHVAKTFEESYEATRASGHAGRYEQAFDLLRANR